MTRRFSCQNAAVATGGTAFAHLLTLKGVATAPDEWAFNLQGAPGAAGEGLVFLSSAPTTTGITLSCSGATSAVDLHAWINHSIVK